MGNTETHKMGTHPIDSGIALQGKLIHYTDSMESPAQGRLIICHHWAIVKPGSVTEAGWSQRPAFTQEVPQLVGTIICASLFLWLQY